MQLAEQNLERLYQFFNLTTCAIIASQDTRYPRLSVAGSVQWMGATTPLAGVGVFHDISATQACEVATLAGVTCFIFVQRGNFYLYASDGQAFSIADTAHGIHGDAVTGQAFSLRFDQGDGGDTMQHLARVAEEARLWGSVHEDKGQAILVGGIGVMRIDQAENELAVWLAEIQAKADAHDFRAARQGLSMAQAYVDALAQH